MDGIWFDSATGDEYLAVLSAKHFNGAQDDDKSENDYLVLAKTLSRMLLQLHTRVNNLPEETRKMRVTGICEHAYCSRILTVQMTGHVTVLHTIDDVDYPTHPENIRQWTQIMETRMAIRQEIQKTKALIKGFPARGAGKKHQPSALSWLTPTKPETQHKADCEQK